jgi:hypothetical protein
MAESADDQGRAPASTNRRPFPIDVTVVGGPVGVVDQAYAWEALGDLRRLTPRMMERGCVHLCTGIDGNGRSIAVVDAFMVLDGDLVICAAGVAPKMRDAIDHLALRLRRRVFQLREHDLSTLARSQRTSAGVFS